MPFFTKEHLQLLIQFRHELHKIPETAHQENETANCVQNFLSDCNPDRVITDIGGKGIAAIYNGKAEGPTVMLRCELDGLPIPEVNDFEYRSNHEGKGHKCGHDGHMAMVAGMALCLSKNRPESGRVILLFQPAEETGEGAIKILKDPLFKNIQPDLIFALHNLPGYPKGQIVVKEGVFASASRGMIIKLKGRTSHASHPANGENPALAASQIVQSFFMIPQMKTDLHHAALITPIHIRVGQPAFGTSAGSGEVMFTLRSHRDEEMQVLTEKAENHAEAIAKAHNLKIEISYTEKFEAVNNDDKCVDFIKKVARESQFHLLEKNYPFPWSEDFGQFTSKFSGALFGLGAGEDTPQLHNEDYDFPDDILETGLIMFQKIVDQILNQT